MGAKTGCFLLMARARIIFFRGTAGDSGDFGSVPAPPPSAPHHKVLRRACVRVVEFKNNKGTTLKKPGALAPEMNTRPKAGRTPRPWAIASEVTSPLVAASSEPPRLAHRKTLADFGRINRLRLCDGLATPLE